VTGTLRLAGAFEIERRTGRWWTFGGLALGSVEIVLGVIVLFAASGDPRLVTAAIGAWGLVGGTLLILEGLRIRRSPPDAMIPSRTGQAAAAAVVTGLEEADMFWSGASMGRRRAGKSVSGRQAPASTLQSGTQLGLPSDAIQQAPAPQLPSDRFHVQHREVPQAAVGSQPGDLDGSITEVAGALVGAMQVAVHQMRWPHSIHDALKPFPVCVVAREVRRRPPGRRPGEGVGNAGWAVVTYHHVRAAARDQGRFLPAGDLLLRPPIDTLGAARLVQAHAPAAGQPCAAVPLPAMTARQVVDVRPDRDASVRNGVAGHLGKLREILVIPVDKP
jgi:hypothetical protein